MHGLTLTPFLLTFGLKIVTLGPLLLDGVAEEGQAPQAAKFVDYDTPVCSLPL